MNQNNQAGTVEVFFTFLKLGLTSFGGPVAHIGYFHKELVEKRGWITDAQFSQLLAICQFLPGPASSQLGFALGLFRSGFSGAIAAFIAFTLPSALLLIAFASALPLLSGELGTAAIHGLKLVAVAVVADAVLGMSKKLCDDNIKRTIAIFATAVILLLGTAWSQVLVAVLGAVAGNYWCRNVLPKAEHQIKVQYGKRVAGGLLAIFAGLLVFTFMPSVTGDVSEYLAQTFYRAGSLVFGGGHVVLPLLQDAMVGNGVVDNDTFLSGYGAAQAIPGPMFAFAAYLGAVVPANNSSLVNAAVALLFMFLPGFLLLLAALPMWQSISGKPKAMQAIAGVNAAVVGLLAAALYDPIFTSAIHSNVDFVIALVGFSMLTVWRLSALWVVVFCVIASIVMSAL